jgi:predicted acetyltransferase
VTWGRYAVAACAVFVLAAASSSATVADSRDATSRAANGQCRAPTAFTAGSDNEIQGATRHGSLFGLLFGERVPPRAGDELKIVWRMTGKGPLKVSFTAPSGKRKALAFGPVAHGAGSSYQRPGDEWGTGFRFDTSGCWHIRLTRSDNVGDVWLDVRPESGVIATRRPAERPVHLVLRPVRLSDERVVLDAQRALLAEGFNFLVGYRDGMPWSEFVAFLEEQRRGRELPEPWVPATNLLAEIDGEVVGRTSIRHRLNDRLLAIGGHVGYAVLPAHRRRGYATEILRQSLVTARSYDIVPVLVTCDEGNVASARTIERCGGTMENIVDNPEGGPRKRRYWIA